MSPISRPISPLQGSLFLYADFPGLRPLAGTLALGYELAPRWGLGPSCGSGGNGRGHGLRHGEKDTKDGAFALFAADGDVAAVFVDNPLRHGQAQAGSTFAQAVIGLEDLLADFGRHALAGVGNVDAALGTLAGGGEDHLATPVAHRLQTIEHQVQDGLLQQARIGRGVNGRIRLLEAQLHVLELSLGSHEIDQFVQEREQFHGLWLEFDFPGETKEIIQDFLHAGALALHRGDSVGNPAVDWILRTNIFKQKLQIELDRGERVLDFVRQSAGQGAQFGKALVLAGALLQGGHAAIGPAGNQGRNQKAKQTANRETKEQERHAIEE